MPKKKQPAATSKQTVDELSADSRRLAALAIKLLNQLELLRLRIDKAWQIRDIILEK